LLNVLAAMEARERGANEALLIDTDGHVTEGTSSNVFWVKDDQVFTPPLTSGLLPGITRALVFELCERLRLTAGEQLARAETLIDADGVFLSLTSRGVVPVSSIDGRALRISPHVARISLACRETVQRECA
jgi:branched-subunit amino acid aminotransferase/4-amino-4-deoxychorismate lyase